MRHAPENSSCMPIVHAVQKLKIPCKIKLMQCHVSKRRGHIHETDIIVTSGKPFLTNNGAFGDDFGFCNDLEVKQWTWQH